MNKDSIKSVQAFIVYKVLLNSFYKLYVSRGVSLQCKQSAAMMQIASPLAKQFRQMFKPVLPFTTDRVMQTKFVGAFQKWMKYKNENPQILPADLTWISHFQFNSYSSFTDRLHIPLKVSQPDL